MTIYKFAIEHDGRNFEIEGDPATIAAEHWRPGRRYCTAKLSIRCLHCDRLIPLRGAAFRFHPVSFADGRPAMTLRPGTRSPIACSGACREAMRYSTQRGTATPTTASTLKSAGIHFDNNIALIGPENIDRYIAQQDAVAAESASQDTV